MPAVTIFVEGPADQKFIKDLIRFRFNLNFDLERDIQNFRGKDKWAITADAFRKSTASGRTNLLIFDADDSYNSRLIELETRRIELGIEFEVFLLPDGRENGDLETLLQQLTIESKSAQIFDCFESYKSCIHTLNEAYTKPDLKTKIYAYSEILTGSGKEKDRDYTNSEIWDLNHPSLQPLVDFLKPHFS